MLLPERIATARLVLRRPRLDDAAAIFEEYARDPDVTRFMIWRPHRSIADTHEFLPRCLEGWETGHDLSWALTFPADDRVIGMFAIRPNGARADIGYVLGKRWWNQGLMTEAGRAVLDLVWQDPELFRVWAVCDVDNLGSARVLEKLGMQREGALRRWHVHPNVSDEPRDCLVYARVRP